MRRLLDVNLLIALLDPDHQFHENAHSWWAEKPRPWASCPLTENGLVRIMSSSAYRAGHRISAIEIISRLSFFIENSDHQFWHDSVTIRDARIFRPCISPGSKNLTDAYLLALAAANDGIFVSFDPQITLDSVAIAKTRHLEIIQTA